MGDANKTKTAWAHLEEPKIWFLIDAHGKAAGPSALLPGCCGTPDLGYSWVSFGTLEILSCVSNDGQDPRDFIGI